MSSTVATQAKQEPGGEGAEARAAVLLQPQNFPVFHTLNHSFEFVLKFPHYLNSWDICGTLQEKEVSKWFQTFLSSWTQQLSFHYPYWLQVSVWIVTWTLRQLQTTAIKLHHVHMCNVICACGQSATVHKCRSEDSFKKPFLSFQHVSPIDSDCKSWR